VYLSTSKLAVAAVGNLSFAMALAMYNLVIKVCMQQQDHHYQQQQEELPAQHAPSPGVDPAAAGRWPVERGG
jgi:hypothetical protein